MASDLRRLTQQSLREQIGLVTQETFLFHDTIFNNIQFGRLDATQEEVYAAAQMAFAHDFIMAQPQGTTPSSATRAACFPADSNNGSPSRARF